MVAGLALFYLELVIEPIGEQGDEVIHGCLVDEDGDRHVHTICLVGDLNLLFLEEVQELIVLGVADGDVDGSLDNPLDKPRLVNGVGGDVAVCPDEATRPELDSTEVSGNYGNDIMELS